MRKLILFSILFLFFIMPASATFEYQQTFNGLSSLPSDWSTVTRGSGGTATVSDGYVHLAPSGSSSAIGIYNASTSWKHLKLDAWLHANGWSGGWRYGTYGISTNGSTIQGDSYAPEPKSGVYAITAGTISATTITLYESGYTGSTRWEKASTTATLTQLSETNTTFDLVVDNDGGATVYVNGISRCTLPTNVTTGSVLIIQGAYSSPYPSADINNVYLSTTPQYVGESPEITWSSPDEVTTTQYDATPTFSFTSDLTVNYTVTQGETTVSGSGTTYEYTPTQDGYNDYTVSFELEHPALLENITKTYTWHYQAAPTNQAPVLSDFSPNTDQTVYQYETVPLSTNVIGAVDGYPLLSDVVWSENGTTAQTNTSVTSANYDYVADATGDFEISAGVTNGQGTDSEARTVSVLPNSMTISNMEYIPAGDENGVIISFTASNFTAGIPIHGWAPKDFNHTVADKVYTWNYENGTTINYETATSNGEALDFDLETVPEGNYSIRIVSEPVADFSYTFYMNGTQPVVSFNDLSVGGATSILWEFGDSETSTEASPTHTYAAEGTYTVTLTRTNILGTDTKTISAEISSSLLPATSFTANATEGFAPVSVQFTNTSINATGWNWNFGDGSTSTAQNPLHVYTSEGVYTVTLTASNAAGTDTETQTDYINIIKSANFTTSPESGVAPLTVKFNDTSVNALTWAWDFENDGIIDSTIQNPIHTYGNVGYYPVKLSITTLKGNTSYINYVNVNPTSITLLNQLWWFLHSLNFWFIIQAVI